MKIGIDARLSGKKHAGIGRYIENLLIRLPLINNQIEWIYFLHDKTQLAELMQVFGQLTEKENKGITAVEFLKSFKVIYAPIKHYTYNEQKQMPIIFEKENLDLLHVPHFNLPLKYNGKSVITIHDLLWHKKKGLQATTLNPLIYWAKYVAYRYLVRNAVKKTSRILVPTKTTAKHLVSVYPKAKEKVAVTEEGFYVVPMQSLPITRKKIVLPEKYLLYVGSLYPHKNLGVILKALASELNNEKLVVVGARNVFVDKMKILAEKLGVSDRVFFLGFVDDINLADIYQKATVLIQPSLWEGFGLTGLEAMSFKTPVIASRIEVFKEVYGDAVLYFDVNNEKELAKIIKDVLPQKRNELIKKGQERVKKFNWMKMTRETYEVYTSILKK